MGTNTPKKRGIKHGGARAVQLATGRSGPRAHPGSSTIGGRYWWSGAKAVVAVFVGILGLLATFVTLVGPVWPTGPDFSPGVPSSSSPWDIPFVVANKSALFPIRKLTITCYVISALTDTGIEFDEDKTMNSTEEIQTIAPLTQRPYECPF